MVKITAILLIAAVVQAKAGIGQNVTVRADNAKIIQVFNQIQKQSGYYFFYSESILKSAKPVTMNVRNLPLKEALDKCFTDQPFTYAIVNKMIVVKEKEAVPAGSNLSDMLPPPVRIRGRVVDSAGNPISGVSVLIKGTRFGVSTKEDGSFSLESATSSGRLVISYVGYATKEVEYSGNTELTITLASKENREEEFIIVGYGSQKKATLTGSVSTVKMDDVLKDRPVTSTSQALQGAIPGLQITYGSGQPGTSTSINIRGYTSINGGGNPLVVVDNVPMDIDDVNPNDIADVSVLKDASASAIYGGRAAFGVILITTKKGGRNQPVRFDYSNNFALTRPSTLPKKASPLQFVNALNDFGTTTYWSGQDVKTWLTQLTNYQKDPSQFPDGSTTVNSIRYPLAQTDIYGTFFERGFEQIHNFSFSGGSEKTNYRTSMAYTDQDGIVVSDNDSYKRYNFNSYISSALTKNLTASVNVFYNNENQKTPLNYSSLFYNAITFGPFSATDQGTLPSTGEKLPYSSPNNLVSIEVPQQNHTNNLRLFGKLDFTPVKNLKISGEYTYTQTDFSRVEIRNTNRYVNPMTFQLDVPNPTSSYYKYASATNVSALNVYASYTFNIANAHNFTLLAGTNQEESKESGFSANRLNLISSTVPSLSTSTGTSSVDDDFGEYALSGYFYRFNYAYKRRYLLEATGRYDGSSRFPKGDRFGFFPGVSVGWVLTEEPFLKSLKKAFSQLKLRGSYGEIGNQVTYLSGTTTQDYYPAAPGLGAINAGWIDPSTNIVYTTLASPRLVSSSFTWEHIRTYNIGMDVSLLGNRLSGNFDVYREETLGMLVNGSSLPAILGTTPPKQNRANLRVDGWDMSFMWKDNIGNDFHYSIGFNVTGRQAALITKYNNPSKLLSDYYEGMHMNDIWGYTTYGYYKATDFVAGALDNNQMNTRSVTANRGLTPGIAGFQGVYQNPGDIRFVDRNGDSVINAGANTVSNPGDMSIIGNSTRRLQYGITGSISYKDLDVSFFIQGIGNRDVWISNEVYWPYLDQFSGIFTHELNYWTVNNPNGFYPRMYANASGNTGTSRNIQTKYLSNGAYIRLKSVAAGYTYTSGWMRNLHINRMRVFFSGENLLTKDHLPAGLDPEATDLGTGGIYPFLKKYSFGVNINF
ncbi:MAG TPA: TonB-dependent receptor [Puia sp.]|nr:TonB-dependent receptor [Puia sp.]